MKTLLYLPLILVVVASCRKDHSTTQPTPLVQPTDSNKNTITKMNGAWIWLGSAAVYYSPRQYYSFIRYTVLATDTTTVTISGEVFSYDSFDAAKQCYRYHRYQNDPFGHDYLTYYLKENLLVRDWGDNYTSGWVSTGLYKPNNKLKDYIPFIVGSKTLSGTLHDTDYTRLPIDTSYAISTTINFTAMNDSTIVFDKQFFGYDDDTLHYKFTDESAPTVVYQTFNLYGGYSTLTYNYVTKTVIFEQQISGNLGNRYLKLQ